MKLKNLTILSVSAILALSTLTACGDKQQTGGTASNTTSQTQSGEKQGSSIDYGENAAKDMPFKVDLKENSEEESYNFTGDDLTLINTESGTSIWPGMTTAQLEAIVGAPIKTDGDYKIYNGLVVKYENDIAMSLIVSEGNIQENNQTAGRFMTTRGVAIGTSIDDFKKAYGSQTAERSETITDENGNKVVDESTTETVGAIRYMRRGADGSVTYLGGELTDEEARKGTSDVYIIDFTFDNAANIIATIRVSAYDAM